MVRDRLYRFTTYGSLVLIGLLVGLYFTAPRTEQFSPLGEGNYSLQHVESRVDGVTGPAITYADAAVTITGALCSEADEPVPVLTTLGWQAYQDDGTTEITGTFITVGVDIQQTRLPGCEDKTCINPLPPEVVEADTALRAEGVEPRWRVVGFEVPEVDGRFGTRRAFKSTAFQVVPGLAQ